MKRLKELWKRRYLVNHVRKSFIRKGKFGIVHVIKLYIHVQNLNVK